MVITRRCNLSCGYCNEYDRVSAPVPKQTIKSWVDKLAEFRCKFVEYTGGETLLHPDLVELVGYASSYRFEERWIITNGYLLSDAIIDGLNEAGLTHMQLSIDGVNPTETTVKVLRPLRPKLERLAARARFKVQINAVLGATMDREALEVLEAIRSYGFVPRLSIIHDGAGAMKLDQSRLELLRRLNQSLGKRWNESHDYRSRLLRDGVADFRCRAGSRYLYIDEFGAAHWCSQQRDAFTKPFLDYTWQDLAEQFHAGKSCSPTCTVSCVRTASRFDEWRRQDAARSLDA